MAEAERVANLLPDTELADELYDTLLDRLDQLFHLIASISVEIVFVSEADEGEGLADEHPVTEMPLEVVKAEPESEPPHMSTVELRQALAKARVEGADVNAVLKEMGYDRLSALPESRYQELIDKVTGES